RDARAAQSQWQRWRRARWQMQRDSGQLQSSRELCRTKLVQQRHRRQVQRSPQRLARGHATGEASIEILGRVGTEMAGQILDVGLWPDDPAFKRHGIN